MDNWLIKVHFADLLKDASSLAGFMHPGNFELTECHVNTARLPSTVSTCWHRAYLEIKFFRIAGTLEAEMFTCYR